MLDLLRLCGIRRAGFGHPRRLGPQLLNHANLLVGITDLSFVRKEELIVRFLKPNHANEHCLAEGRRMQREMMEHLPVT